MANSDLYTISKCTGLPILNIGAMKNQITIQRRCLTSPPTYDAAGPALGLVDVLTTAAGIDIVRGTDMVKSGQTTTQLYLAIVTWFIPGIIPSMEIVNDGNGSRYLINSVENIKEANIVMVLNCLGLGANI